MDYQYKLIISNKNLYKEFEIPATMDHVFVGTTSNCEFRLNSDYFFEDIEFELTKKDEWTATCKDSLFINRNNVQKLLFTKLKHGDSFSVYYSKSNQIAFDIRFAIDFESEIPRYDSVILLDIDISIGNDTNSNIILNSEYCRGTNIIVQRKQNDYFIVEKKSRYGIYVNGKLINQSKQLVNYDFITIGDFICYFKVGYLYFDGSKATINGLKKYDIDQRVHTDYPMFVRNTRIQSIVDEQKIVILDPANVPQKPELNLLTSLMPAIVMFALVVVLRGFMSTTGGTFIIFSICSMGMGVITSIISIFDKKKKFKKDTADRIAIYNAYIERKKSEILECRENELKILNSQYYSIEEDLRHIENFSSCLFDRIPGDSDFLDVYLGKGTIEAKKKIDYKIQEKLEIGDDLSQLPSKIAEEYKYIENAPIVLKLKESNAIGIIGDKNRQYEVFKNIIIDLITRQYFGDIKLFALIDDNIKDYNWLRLIPHIQSVVNGRNIVCDNESKNNVFEDLYKELNNRLYNKSVDEFNVVLVMNEHGIKSHPISRYIEKASELNTVFIFFETSEELLPLHCSRIVELTESGKGVVFESGNKSDYTEFTYTMVNDETLKRDIEVLAPVFCEEISLESSLRRTISLFELLGIYSVNDIDLTKRWSTSKIYDSMAVPLGVNVKDEVVYLDLHEKYHGPHGLVAGTTGSGKSEILQSFILGSSTLFHPYEIGFVIIDFKGGGMVNQFKKLPHLMGAITNIDGKAINRSLKSIKAELMKRQELFAEANVNHIDKYIKLFKEGKVSQALPHLVIIVDEFAELKAEQPEFMKELISAARIGRSLGVHLILATQKPAGQVNEQIWSNSRFKLCLKVQTQEDSNEVLKSPLAAEIREPGRAYLQVGNNEIFELFQSGFSGAQEKMENNLNSFDVYNVDFKGSRNLVYRKKVAKQRNNRTQLDAIVEYVNQYCEEKSIVKLQEICLPELPSSIDSDKSVRFMDKDIDMNIQIGLYDDPDSQYQGPYQLPVGSGNTLIIGSMQTGKTNLLELIIKQLASLYSPKEVNMYILDFGSMVLKNFEKLNHVGGVVCPSDDEKFKNLIKYLNEQIIERREKMVSVGVSSFSAYKEANYTDLPMIFVFIDNFTALKELYLSNDDVLMNLCREGTSVGINFVVSNSMTSGLGYRYLANFSNRISLFCNEYSEYASIFGLCRMRPDEVPGRGIVEIEKTLYECQTYLAFKGEKEIERVMDMNEFIEGVNDQYTRIKATRIPEIPEYLSERYMEANYVLVDSQKITIGLDYATVAPIMMSLSRPNLLALSGPDDSGKANFIKYFVNSIVNSEYESSFFIFDDYRKKLSSLCKYAEISMYETQGSKFKDFFTSLELELQNAYQGLMTDCYEAEERKIIILNNPDVVEDISNDKSTISIIKDIVSKYKMLNVYIILGCVPNGQIVYGSPELYKMAKETRNILYFDNLDMCKIVDVPVLTIKNNRKRISKGDAYYIHDLDFYKVKTPIVEE